MPSETTQHARRILRFPALLAGLLPVAARSAETSGTAEAAPEVHAEALHALCTADGLLELLDWTRRGVGADPLACLWLGSLRWHRLITGGFPDAAPQPPARDLDEALRTGLAGGDIRLLSGSAAVSLAGLASGEMACPSAPAQPEAAAADALVRVLPLAFVPYVEPEMLRSWADQTVCLTQGEATLRRRAGEVVQALHAASGAPDGAEVVSEMRAQLDEVLDGGPLATVIGGVFTRVQEALNGSVPTVGDLHPRIRGFARSWTEVMS